MGGAGWNGAPLRLFPCFREIVKGSHLRPLEQKDVRGDGGFHQTWNTAACDKKPKDVGESGDLSAGMTVVNLQSFVREWRRLASQSQAQYRCWNQNHYSVTNLSRCLQVSAADWERETLTVVQSGNKVLHLSTNSLFSLSLHSMGLLGEMLAVMNKVHNLLAQTS